MPSINTQRKMRTIVINIIESLANKFTGVKPMFITSYGVATEVQFRLTNLTDMTAYKAEIAIAAAEHGMTATFDHNAGSIRGFITFTETNA